MESLALIQRRFLCLPMKSKEMEESCGFTEEEELGIAAWIEDHNVIYNQVHKDFKNRQKKDALWDECGQLFGVPGEFVVLINSLYQQICSIYFRKVVFPCVNSYL